MYREVSLGAIYLGNDRCLFRVWAPLSRKVSVRIVSPCEREIPLRRDERGYYSGVVERTEPGTLYFYLLDGEKLRPDPASRYQPEGVHGPSQVIDPRTFQWSDQCWFGLGRRQLVLYELHVGAFAPDGTFDAVIPYLDELKELGITALELMPVAQFPGARNWGYDGVYPYAVQSSYGGPEGLRRLVDACHARRLGVILDVVYNHLGPEGNYLAEFGPYFTERYRTPWGEAINFDGPHSDEVRRFFIENAIYWLEEFHVDGFRLDAVHGIFDFSAVHFLQELSGAVRRRAERLGRRVQLIAESDLNDPRLIRPEAVGGYGFDAQWNDDYHHALHVLLTGERRGYYRDYETGTLEQLARAMRRGYIYTGQYSRYRRRRHGSPTWLCDASQFVVFSQNHDQVGNRAAGERLSAMVSFSGLKLAASLVMFSPFIPLIFMGEEYGETSPFQYFTSHSDPELARAVREGRRREFASFGWEAGVPDPQSEQTFLFSKLRHELKEKDHHRVLFEFYRELIRLRREIPALAELDGEGIEVAALRREQILVALRWNGADQVCIVWSFSTEKERLALPVPGGSWRKLFDSEEERWLGEGSEVPRTIEPDGEVRFDMPPKSCVLFKRLHAF